MRSMACLIVLSVLTAAPAAGQPPASPGWTPDEIMKLRSVGDVQLSGDGRRVAYTVTEAVMTDERSEYLTQVHIASTDGSGHRQLTFGDRSSSAPRWSPDGLTIAFASARSGRRNIWLLPVEGGEARQLTDVRTAVGAFKWSPAGDQIAFLMADPPSAAEDRASRSGDDARVVGEGSRLTRLWVVPFAAGDRGRREPRLVTTQDFSVGHVVAAGHSFNWSPDGKSLVFAHTPTPRYEDLFHAQISSVDLASGRLRRLVPAMSALRQPIWSPDGRWIAYQAIEPGLAYYFSVWNVMVMPADGGPARALAETPDRLGFLGGGSLIGWSAARRSRRLPPFPRRRCCCTASRTAGSRSRRATSSSTRCKGEACRR